jgi:hypothetical protein
VRPINSRGPIDVLEAFLMISRQVAVIPKPKEKGKASKAKTKTDKKKRKQQPRVIGGSLKEEAAALKISTTKLLARRKLLKASGFQDQPLDMSNNAIMDRHKT